MFYNLLHALVVSLRFAAANYVLWSICAVMYASVYLITCPCMVMLFCQLFMYEVVQNVGLLSRVRLGTALSAWGGSVTAT